MSYYPLQRRGSPRNKQQVLTSMGVKGMNLRDLPQFLDIQFALNIENYYTLADGKLEKRKGLERLFETAATSGVTLFEKYTDDLYIFGYASSVKAYRISTDTVISIKTNFTTSDPFEGVKYGDYFFVCNGGDKVGRISQTLAYDGQSTNFTVGNILTGGTSGATAVILEDSDSGATGTLTLGSVSGTFQNNEALTDPDGGDGNANGTLTLTYTEISGAPKAKVLYAFDGRLFCGNTETDPTEIVYSAKDDGTNPPFTDFTAATGAADPGSVRFGNGGDIKAIQSLGSQVVAFGEDGKFAFRIETIDSAGTLVQDVVVDFYRVDFGGSRAALTTKKGLFYANEGGLWQMVTVGETNVPFSDNEDAISVRLLGRDYFDDITLTNADIEYDDKRNVIYLSCGKDSTGNNQVIVYDLERGAFSLFKGWNISRFLKDGATFYGSSSITYTTTAEVRFWELFNGYSDDGSDIYTVYEQELNFGALYARKTMHSQYFQGALSPSTSLDVRFDIYDREGVKVSNKKIVTWTAETGGGGATGWGESSWGESAFGGDVQDSELIENFAGASGKISNFQRIRVRITGNDQVKHIINWMSVLITKQIPIRRRNLTTT